MSISTICNDSLEAIGRQVYQDNDFFKNFSNVVNNPEFMEYFSNNFKTWLDVKTQIMLLKTHEFVGNKYPELSSYERLAVLKDIINNSETRREMVKEMEKFESPKLGRAITN